MSCVRPGRRESDGTGGRATGRTLLVSRHLPDPRGSAAGRVLWATAYGLAEHGQEVLVVSWSPAGHGHARRAAGSIPGAGPVVGCVRPVLSGGPLDSSGQDQGPAGDPPASWGIQAVATPPGHQHLTLAAPRRAARTHLRAIAWPRGDAAGLRAHLPAGAATADDPVSWAAVCDRAGSVLTLHYATVLDRRALGGWTAATLQDWRAERAAVRRADRTLVYSERVGRWVQAVGGRPVLVPVAIPVPTTPLEPVEDPVACLIADWRWPANRAALRTLLAAWADVRRALPAARLLVAGRGAAPFDGSAGVENLGAVPDARAVLGRAALVAFPCPATSGPKVKSLEALAAGVDLLTTPAGAEGIAAAAVRACRPVAPERFAAELTARLADPAGRAERARVGRAAVLAAHTPAVATRARLAALGT